MEPDGQQDDAIRSDDRRSPGLPVSPGTWAGRLQQLARPVLAGTPMVDSAADNPAGYLDGFADERGHRRRSDRLLLAWMLGLPMLGARLASSRAPEPEEPLWNALIEGASSICASSPEGPLFPMLHDGPIEVWTEAELRGLHWLWWLARRRRVEPERVESAVAWHLAELQPDNATGHPWGVHAFIAHWCDREDRAALVHAETMIHACMLDGGQPDRVSACILLDAARGLDELAQTA